MDQRAQLIEALSRLSQNCLQVAKLLDELPIIPQPSDIVNINEKLYTTVADLTALIPVTYYKAPSFNIIEGGKVLEITMRKSALRSVSRIKQLHVVYIDHPSEINHWDNIKILKDLDSTDSNYDMILLNECVEFIPHPIQLLSQLKAKICQHGKIFIRFRPWSASHGGFLEQIGNNMPYAHILLKNCGQLSKPVVNIAIRPINTYNTYIAKAGLTVVSMQAHGYNAPLPQKLFEYVINNIWGSISTEDAKRILSVHNVDYLISK